MKIDTLRLGIQTNIGMTERVALWKAMQWAHKQAKSFNIQINHTDYNGSKVDTETGYAIAIITYYTTQKEGAILVDTNMKYPKGKIDKGENDANSTECDFLSDS